MVSARRPSPLRERITLIAVLVGITLLVAHQGWLWRWDRLIFDAQLRLWARPPSPDIVIVAIDEASLATLGRWPWSRAVHGQLVEILHREGARVIGFDIIFAEADTGDPFGDARLVRAVADSARVVLPVHMEQPHLGGQPAETLPFPPLAEAAAALGHVHVELDPDGIARSLYLREGIGGPHWEHLSLALLRVARGNPAPLPAQAPERGAPMVWARADPVLIPYAGPPGHFHRLSFIQVLEGDYPAAAFRDKLVLVGTTATGLGDALPTPVSGHSHAMSGVEINANILDAQLRQVRIIPLEQPWNTLLSGVLVLAALVAFPYCLPRTNLLIILGLVSLALGVNLLLANFAERWYAPAAALLALAFAYPLWSWRRLEQTVTYLNEELEQLRQEQTELIIQRTPDPAAGLAFVARFLPLAGWRVTDQQGVVMQAQGKEPSTAAMPAQPCGRWLQQERELWTDVRFRGAVLRLALRLAPHSSLTHPQQRLLDALLEPSTLAPPRPSTDLQERLLTRLQQVQWGNTRLRNLYRFINDSLARMADGVLVTSRTGQILLGNARAAEYLGHPGDQALHEIPFFQLLGELRLANARSWDQVLETAYLGQQPVQVDARHGDGRDLLVQITPLQHTLSGLDGVVINLSDISELKASERKRTELLNFLSHDLRSPLVSQLALVELAREQERDPELMGLLERIRQHSERTLNLAEQFLQLARAESGESLPFQEVDLAAVALNAVEEVWAQAQHKGMRLETELERQEAWVHGDGSLLERALVNLLTNAIKYSPERRTVGIRLDVVGAQYRVCVQDRGYGIPRDHLPRLFDRFQRIHRGESRGERGAGLGLAFVEAVARRHRGRVEVESEEGVGSRFCLVLPAATTGSGTD